MSEEQKPNKVLHVIGMFCTLFLLGVPTAYIYLAIGLGYDKADVLWMVSLGAILIPVVLIFWGMRRSKFAVGTGVAVIALVFLAAYITEIEKTTLHEQQRASSIESNERNLASALETINCADGSKIAVYGNPDNAEAKYVFRQFHENMARQDSAVCHYFSQGSEVDVPYCSGLTSLIRTDKLRCSSDKYDSLGAFVAAYYGGRPLRVDRRFELATINQIMDVDFEFVQSATESSTSN